VAPEDRAGPGDWLVLSLLERRHLGVPHFAAPSSGGSAQAWRDAGSDDRKFPAAFRNPAKKYGRRSALVNLQIAILTV